MNSRRTTGERKNVCSFLCSLFYILYFFLLAVRIFRAVILFEGVQVLLNALLNTVLKSAGSVSLLLIMLWIFFAVVGYYSFGYDYSEGPIYEEWGTLGNAVISLLTFLFVSIFCL